METTFGPVFEEVKFDSRRRLAVTQAVVEARLLPQPGTVIARVLSITAVSSVTSGELFAGEARYGGRVDMRVLFVDVDGRNHAIEQSADFSGRVESEQIGSDATPVFSSRIIDTDVTAVSPGEIKLAVVAEVALDADAGQTVRYLSAGGEGLFCRDASVDYTRLVGSGEGTFSLKAEIGGVRKGALLSADHRAVVTGCTAQSGSVLVKGLIVSEATVDCSDGLLASYRAVTPFEEEIAAADSLPGCVALVGVALDPTAELAEGETENAVELNYTVRARFAVYESATVGMIADAFSPGRELVCSRESVTLVRNKPPVYVADRVDGSVTLEVNMPIVDNILAATALALTVVSVTAGEDEAVVEGVVGGNVIYYSAEANAESSVEVELPFSLRTRAEGVCEGDTLTACGEVTSVAVKIRRGNEISLSAEIALEIDACSAATVSVIGELTEGEKKDVPTTAFSVRVARKGETLWDIAKALGATPEQIAGQNPGLEPPFSGGERVILYRHLEK